MGDAQVFLRTATYNMDVAAFFTKWMIDVEDAQTSGRRFSRRPDFVKMTISRACHISAARPAECRHHRSFYSLARLRR